jgi:hypothetical protein
VTSYEFGPHVMDNRILSLNAGTSVRVLLGGSYKLSID